MRRDKTRERKKYWEDKTSGPHKTGSHSLEAPTKLCTAVVEVDYDALTLVW